MNKSLITQSFEHFIQKLQLNLVKPLPGATAHQEMLSRVANPRNLNSYHPNKTKTGSILIHFFEKNSIIYSTLIERQKYDGVHSGQISFPGGKKDPEDVSEMDTALREAEEEVNIRQKDVITIGSLSPLYIAASDFIVHPVIGYSYNIPDFIPEKKEVAEIINFPIQDLFKENIKKETILNIRGHQIHTPYYNINNKIVWGATSMILSELISITKPKLK